MQFGIHNVGVLLLKLGVCLTFLLIGTYKLQHLSQYIKFM